MLKIYTVPCGENIIEVTAEIIYSKGNRDLSRIAVVFPHRRPYYYLKSILKKYIQTPFFPPAVFTMDEFMYYLVLKKYPFGRINQLDAIYLVWCAAKATFDQANDTDGLSKFCNNFFEFFPWSFHLLSLFEQLDMHLVSVDKIEHLSAYQDHPHAKILLGKIKTLYQHFVQHLNKYALTTRGLSYRTAAEIIHDLIFDEFEKIYFVGFYALTKAEQEVLRHLCTINKAEIIIQSAKEDMLHRKWQVSWNATFIPLKEKKHSTCYHFHEAHNIHSQLKKVKELLNLFGDVKNADELAIILPRETILRPLLGEVIAECGGEYNISMGYPLKYTPLYTLFQQISQAQQQMQHDNLYYFKSYLEILQHPYIKNIYCQNRKSIRHGIYKLCEAILRENRESGRVLFSLAQLTELASISIEDKDILQSIIQIHKLFFENFQIIQTPEQLSFACQQVLRFLVENSNICEHPLNKEYIFYFYQVAQDFKLTFFAKEKMHRFWLFLIFLSIVERERIPFEGDPLRGIQILGLLESRLLSFKRVIILDVNEGILPQHQKYEPLLPQDIRAALGLYTYKEFESLFGYHFFRLVDCAQHAHLIYSIGKTENERGIPSRFLEKLIWLIEKKKKELLVGESIEKVSYCITLPKKTPLVIKKSQQVLKTLMERTYNPTSIDVYIQCPVKFYLREIIGLKVTKTHEEIQQPLIGQIVHEIFKEFYQSQFEAKFINFTPQIEQKFINIVHTIVDRRFGGNLGGQVLLLRELLLYRIRNFIAQEKKRIETYKKIYLQATEATFTANLPLKNNKIIKLKGTIDRIDKIDNKYFIIDYKTSSSQLPPKKIIFCGEAIDIAAQDVRVMIKRKIKSLQLPLYIYLYACAQKVEVDSLMAAFYLLSASGVEGLVQFIEYPQYSCNHGLYMKLVEKLFEQVLDGSLAFEPDTDGCDLCEYFCICKN